MSSAGVVGLSGSTRHVDAPARSCFSTLCSPGSLSRTVTTSQPTVSFLSISWERTLNHRSDKYSTYSM